MHKGALPTLVSAALLRVDRYPVQGQLRPDLAVVISSVPDDGKRKVSRVSHPDLSPCDSTGVQFHGGGMQLLSLKPHDRICRSGYVIRLRTGLYGSTHHRHSTCSYPCPIRQSRTNILLEWKKVRCLLGKRLYTPPWDGPR